jgi:hypothetical protein
VKTHILNRINTKDPIQTRKEKDADHTIGNE